MSAREIIAKWPSVRVLARELGLSHWTVYSWHRRNSIPADRDVALVSAASKFGVEVSYEDLARARHMG